MRTGCRPHRAVKRNAGLSVRGSVVTAVATDLYETDFVAWTREQAAELRRLRDARINSRLDLEQLAEEIEDLGKEQRAAVRSQVQRIIEHLLKDRKSVV